MDPALLSLLTLLIQGYVTNGQILLKLIDAASTEEKQTAIAQVQKAIERFQHDIDFLDKIRDVTLGKIQGLFHHDSPSPPPTA